MEERLFAHPVIAHEIPVIRGQHDHRVVHAAGLFEPVEQNTHLVVALLDQAHIGAQDLVAHVVARECLRHGRVHEALEDAVIALPFRVAAHGRQEILRPVHAGIGVGHDIGPMRLDVGQVAAPAPCALLADEIHAAPGQVRGFAVFLADVGGFVGIRQEPARQHVAVRVDPGIRESRATGCRCHSPSARR